jgi:hypothetical protein
MKKLLLMAPVCLLAGCGTPPQTVAFNTIGSVEATATTTYDDYVKLVIQGTVSTNSVPQVSKIFNQIQASGLVAEVASAAGTNALAPAELTEELATLVNLVSTLK